MNETRENLISKMRPLHEKLGCGHQLNTVERTALNTWLGELQDLDAKTQVPAGSPGYKTVIVNGDGQLLANPALPTTPIAPAKMVDENPFRTGLYADKRCSVRRCKSPVNWRVLSGKWRDPHSDHNELPNGVRPMGPVVMDSLQAQLEFAAGSAKNAPPMGALVEDSATYFCEIHWREREREMRAAAEAEVAKRKADALPFLWSLDPTNVRVDLADDGNFLLTFPDFTMPWESYRVDELTAWRKRGRRVSR